MSEDKGRTMATKVYISVEDDNEHLVIDGSLGLLNQLFAALRQDGIAMAASRYDNFVLSGWTSAESIDDEVDEWMRESEVAAEEIATAAEG